MTGEISFTKDDDLCQNGMVITRETPSAQLFMHEKAIISFLNDHGFKDVPVKGILCFGAREGVQIKSGSNHFLTTKADKLVGIIINLKPMMATKPVLTQDQIRSLAALIDAKHTPNNDPNFSK